MDEPVTVGATLTAGRIDITEPLYIEIYDGALRDYLSGMFSEETIAKRHVSLITVLPDGKWLIKLSHDPIKEMKTRRPAGS